MTRPKGNTSPRIAETARQNGKKGGRPGGALPHAMLVQLGPAPFENPIKLARWYTSALAMLSQLRLSGVSRGIDKLAKEIRSNAMAAGKVLPQDIIFAAARIVRDDEDDLAADGGPEEEEIERDPGTAAAVRCDS